MANIILENDKWETSGVYDITEGKTQREVNAALKGSITSLGSDDIANDSTNVSGPKVTNALDTLNGAVTDKILYFASQAVSATTGNILDISNAKITADYVLLECTFATPKNIKTRLTWTTSAGHFVLNGTCSGATTANITLGKKGN